jgi:redox-sensitive bicupin YhaK (pirin superfamily)
VADVDVRRGQDRALTSTEWLKSRHSFSFASHYSPDNLGFGLLIVHNEDFVAAHAGFERHAHREMEIVTWVLSGELEHRDSAGNHGRIYPGLAQRMTAGSGIVHSEMNPGDQPVHFVQMWVPPDTPELTPGYQQADVADLLSSGVFAPVASGLEKHHSIAPIAIHQRDAGLLVGRLAAESQAAVPVAPFVHLFVARGFIDLEGTGPMYAGDAVRITDADGQALTVIDDAELLLWEMHSTAMP